LREDKEESELREEKETPVQKIMKKSKGKNTEVDFTHREKIYFPKEGYTKGDIIDYYKSMSDYILPYLMDRPLSLNRHPNGIDKPNFFQKNITSELPEFADTIRVPSESAGHDINYLVCRNKETLLYMANLGCIEMNPWISRANRLDYPDFMLIDLDPGDNTWDELVKTAKRVKKYLDMSCEKSYIKTSGKTGLHIVVPMGGKYHFEEIKEFAHLIARLVERDLPEITSTERSPAKRKNKIYLDYLQNRIGQTIAAPYSVRPAPGATVSTPIEWKELTEKFNKDTFTIKTIGKRVKAKGDLWKNILKEKTDLKESIDCLRKALGEEK
jgi:bifunctional non-homologous end joining protein LigD